MKRVCQNVSIGTEGFVARPLAERLASMTTKTAACWFFTGTTRKGYGSIKVGNGKQRLQAHRVAYEIANGPIPAGLLVRHSCDNPICVRPDHLLVGTVADNSADMRSRGRSLAGERNPKARLTRRAAETIRSRRAGGDLARQIAADFGVSVATVYGIEKRRIWK